MKTIVEMKFGSHLYGTDTPASDLDLKAVFIPGGADILLQRAKPVQVNNSKADPRVKNTAEDTDSEAFSLQRFLGLCAEGQTVALDMLFAPKAMLLESSYAWAMVQENRSKLLSRQYKSFVGYCKSQANKYGIKGSRVAAARAALGLLSAAMARYGTGAKLSETSTTISELVAVMPDFMSVYPIENQVGSPVLHWEVCGRKMPFTASIKSAFTIMDKIVDNYGHRALQAEQNQGVDWKSLSHAVRIADQAVELLETGVITFPRPNAAHLKRVKAGEFDYAQVAEEIEGSIERVEGAALVSPLPDEPDREWMERFVQEMYVTQVVRGRVF